MNLAEEVVLTMGRSPQTQTPLPEPWLHHNQALGGLQDCCSLERLGGSHKGHEWRPLEAGIRYEAVAHRGRLTPEVHSNASTACVDVSSTNSESAPSAQQAHSNVELCTPRRCQKIGFQTCDQGGSTNCQHDSGTRYVARSELVYQLQGWRLK